MYVVHVLDSCKQFKDNTEMLSLHLKETSLLFQFPHISGGRGYNINRPFRCSVCEKTFTMKHNLVSHMKRHQGIFPYHCPVCGKGVYSRGDKLSHMTTHHPDHPETVKEQQYDQQRSTIFQGGGGTHTDSSEADKTREKDS